jgi:hypothetical protein
VDNIKMDLREKERIWDIMDCIHLAQERDNWRALVSIAMNLQVA